MAFIVDRRYRLFGNSEMPAATKRKAKRPSLGERLVAAMGEVKAHADGKPNACRILSAPSWSHCVVELRKRRLADGLTQADIAARSGLRIEIVSKLELGKIADPSLAILDGYAAALGVKIVYRLEAAAGEDSSR